MPAVLPTSHSLDAFLTTRMEGGSGWNASLESISWDEGRVMNSGMSKKNFDCEQMVCEVVEGFCWKSSVSLTHDIRTSFEGSVSNLFKLPALLTDWFLYFPA